MRRDVRQMLGSAERVVWCCEDEVWQMLGSAERVVRCWEGEKGG